MTDDVVFLASDALEGRAPGSAGNEAALAYVESEFASLGLEPAAGDGTSRQSFTSDDWGVDGTPEVEVGVEALSAEALHPFAFSGSGEVTAELVFVGYGLTIAPFDPAAFPDCPLGGAEGYDDYEGVDVTGRVVLVLRHGPRDDVRVHEGGCPAPEVCEAEPCLWTFGYKAANARLHGAVPRGASLAHRGHGGGRRGRHRAGDPRGGRPAPLGSGRALGAGARVAISARARGGRRGARGRRGAPR